MMKAELGTWNLERGTIAIGMSGGVDSSAAAALLVEQGCAVLGITARMLPEGVDPQFEESLRHARDVAAFLGIRHVVVDAVDYFQRTVLDTFAAEYHGGRTPSPCILCNQYVKFGHLFMRARKLGCSHLATGHYARIDRRADGAHLLCGRDAAKDQSYFLHRLSQEQLATTLFPLGEWTKDEARAYVARRGLPAVTRSESQDLCFIRDNNYAGFIERAFPELRKKGRIVDDTGTVRGEHNGYHRYTIGQREGLGVAAATRLYVKELRPDANEVVVAQKDAVFSSGCRVGDVHWILANPGDTFPCAVKLRYRNKGVAATVRQLENRRACVTFEERQFAVTPGQAAVFYRDDEALGGGWIESAGSEKME